MASEVPTWEREVNQSSALMSNHYSEGSYTYTMETGKVLVIKEELREMGTRVVSLLKCSWVVKSSHHLYITTVGFSGPHCMF